MNVNKLKKKNRKVKKASYTSAIITSPLLPCKSSNKENLQIKSLLLTDFKRSCINVSRLECISNNKNQMTRNNKNATFNARNVNSKQRKYHKLQQPIFCNNFSQ
jgi:hypothetical protein